jgi:hypothetical protein
MNCLRKRLALFAIAALCCSSALAAPPKITRLSIRGFQIGGTTRLIVQGTDLGTEPKLLFDWLNEQKLIGEAKPTTAEFDVSITPSAAAGVYHLRLATTEGVSTPEIVTVDALPQRLIAPTGGTVAKLVPVAMHGTLAGSAVQELTFPGKRGESVTIDVLARRMGSRLRPVVHLYDDKKNQLAWSLPQTALAGDSRITAVLPADGNYIVAVHDLTYAAANPGYYRVAIGSFDCADQVFPPVVERGVSTPLELVGRFGKQARAEQHALFDDADAADRPLPWPADTAPVGLRPRVGLSDFKELVEGRSLDKSRTLPPSADRQIAVSGRLQKPNETDLYHLELAAEEKVVVEVFADRLGSPIDATLELRDEKGARLAGADDVAGPDPKLEYTAPKKPSRVTIAVADALRRGDESCIYRVVVTKQDAAKAASDFRLTFAEDTHNVPRDGAKVVRVMATRTGYDGAIRLTVEGLPKGFAATPVDIPPGGDGALVELRATGDAQASALGPITIRGTSVGLKPAITRTAESSVHPLAALQPWMKTEAVVAAMQSPAPLVAAWADESATAQALYQGTDDKFTIRLERDPAAKGNVRLSLITTQAPAGNPQQAAAQMLRGLTPTVDVKPDPKKDTADFAIRVPADLRQADYDLALKAELLSADGRTTVAEAFTPPRRFKTLPPIEIVADAPPQEPVELDEKRGAVITLAGKLKRLKKYEGDVTITLVGLPKDVTAPSAVLKAKQEDYKLEFKLPPSFAAAKIEGVKVSATITPDNRRVNTAGKAEAAVPTISVSRRVLAAPASAGDGPTQQKKKP